MTGNNLQYFGNSHLHQRSSSPSLFFHRNFWKLPTVGQTIFTWLRHGVSVNSTKKNVNWIKHLEYQMIWTMWIPLDVCFPHGHLHTLNFIASSIWWRLTQTYHSTRTPFITFTMIYAINSLHFFLMGKRKLSSFFFNFVGCLGSILDECRGKVEKQVEMREENGNQSKNNR